jgi:hypothetical protein
VDQEVEQRIVSHRGRLYSRLGRSGPKTKALDRLEAQLIEGLDSPASEMTQEDWDDIRREGLAEIRANRARHE